MAPSMVDFDLDAYVGRSRALDLSAFAWNDVPRHPVPAEAVRTLRYMQDIESHTIIYLRELLATRAVDDPEVSDYTDVSQLPRHKSVEIRRFFTDYKALEAKSVVVEELQSGEKALAAVVRSFELYRKHETQLRGWK